MTPKFNIGDKVFVFDRGLKEKTIKGIEITENEVRYKFSDERLFMFGCYTMENECFVSKEEFIESLK